MLTFGHNENGSCGTGTIKHQKTPFRLNIPRDIRQIALGTFHSLILMENGDLIGFGMNNVSLIQLFTSLILNYSPLLFDTKEAQLGNLSPGQILIPTLIFNDKEIDRMTCSRDSNLFVTKDGSIKVMGVCFLVFPFFLLQFILQRNRTILEEGVD